MTNVVVAVLHGDVEGAIRRLRNKVSRNHIGSDIRRTEYYLPPGKKRRLKSLRAQIKRRKLAAKL
jgi:ribosomal protein S21